MIVGGQIRKELFGLRAKTCNYLKDNNNEDKKAHKKIFIKVRLNFQDYKNC